MLLLSADSHNFFMVLSVRGREGTMMRTKGRREVRHEVRSKRGRGVPQRGSEMMSCLVHVCVCVCVCVCVVHIPRLKNCH